MARLSLLVAAALLGACAQHPDPTVDPQDLPVDLGTLERHAHDVRAKRVDTPVGRTTYYTVALSAPYTGTVTLAAPPAGYDGPMPHQTQLRDADAGDLFSGVCSTMRPVDQRLTPGAERPLAYIVAAGCGLHCITFQDHVPRDAAHKIAVGGALCDRAQGFAAFRDRMLKAARGIAAR